MPKLSKLGFAAALLLMTAWVAFAAEPIRRIAVYVQPYYESAVGSGAAPKVRVGQRFDELLSSMRREDIVAVRDAVEASPQNVTPMTMMVLAIRLYDMGLRDDSVFWFYVAKARFSTLEDVVDARAPALSQASEAVKGFATLAGPVINGYAFCDRAKQHATIAKAIDWVEANPYYMIFLDRLAAKPGDRNAKVQQSIKMQRARADQEYARFDDPKFLAQFTAARRKNSADTAFCWK